MKNVKAAQLLETSEHLVRLYNACFKIDVDHTLVCSETLRGTDLYTKRDRDAYCPLGPSAVHLGLQATNA